MLLTWQELKSELESLRQSLLGERRDSSAQVLSKPGEVDGSHQSEVDAAAFAHAASASERVSSGRNVATIDMLLKSMSRESVPSDSDHRVDLSRWQDSHTGINWALFLQSATQEGNQLIFSLARDAKNRVHGIQQDSLPVAELTTETNRFAAKAAEMGVREPTLPFKSMSMDGKTVTTDYGSTTHVWPTALQAFEQRLNQLGTFWSHQGVIEFVTTNGEYHVARDIRANSDALEMARYREVSGGVAFTNGQVPITDRTLFDEIFRTPQNESERLIWAASKHLDIEQVQRAIANGAISTDRLIRESLLDPSLFVIFDTLHLENTDERDAVIRTLLPESRHASADGVTVLHAALDSPYPTLSVLPDLLKAGVNPLALDKDGTPAFLVLRNAKGTAREELQLVTEAMLATEGLSPAEKKTIQAQTKLLNNWLGAEKDPVAAEKVMGQLRRVWQAAANFPHETDTSKIPIWVQEFLEPLTDPKRASKLLETLEHYDIGKLSTINDLVREFTTHVVYPQVVLNHFNQTGTPVTDSEIKAFESVNPKLFSSLLPMVQEALFRGRSLDRIIGLNEAWHDHRVFFPDSLKPLAAEGEWHSLTGQKQHSIPDMPGISIHVLTDGYELAREGKIMDHCVGGSGYVSKGLKGETHIFSVRKDGVEVPLSTIEATWNGRNFDIQQNYSIKNKEPSAEAASAALWFKDQLETGKISTNGQLGETDASKAKNTRPLLLRTIGFELTQENINAAFSEFGENDKRRAREFNPKTGEFDLISRRTELLAGNYTTQLQSHNLDGHKPQGGDFILLNKEGEPKRTDVPQKRLPADKWLQANSIAEKAATIVRPPYPTAPGYVDRTTDRQILPPEEVAKAGAQLPPHLGTQRNAIQSGASNGIGVAMGAYGLYSKFNDKDGTFHDDIKSGDSVRQTLAVSGFVSDFVNIGAGGVSTAVDVKTFQQAKLTATGGSAPAVPVNAAPAPVAVAPTAQAATTSGTPTVNAAPAPQAASASATQAQGGTNAVAGSTAQQAEKVAAEVVKDTAKAAQEVSQASEKLLKAGKFASKVAIPLALATGTFDASAGSRAGDRERVAGAFGSTVLGILGGAGAGMAAGAVTGAIWGSVIPGWGTVTVGVLAGLGGGIYGAMVGEEKAKEHLSSVAGRWIGSDDKFLEAIKNLDPATQKQFAKAGAKLTLDDVHQILKGGKMDSVARVDTSTDGKISGAELKQALEKARAVFIDNQLTEQLSALEAKGWGKNLGNKDGKLTLDEVKASLKEKGIELATLVRDDKITGRAITDALISKVSPSTNVASANAVQRS